ncbi:hypothetical protein MUN77_01735 [Leucobacter allii]|uniref:hypothetical protein n=1 Tax=Leucobacter allii TaxID=2932247 RepID=UPI001FD22740|nr:hypothetical protein [Leucobacter allii]UOR02081.1 hypothetical protein MUN77_01735 [Leucobacter allii]
MEEIMGAMKELATALEGLGVAGIASYRSELDGAVVIDLDTVDDVGRVRVTLNDGVIWDGDPEQDVPAMLDGFEISHTWEGLESMFCLACIQDVDLGEQRTLRAYVAAAKAHAGNCTKG